jgi:predicted RNA binding protein YcfA (HicA-like mRNA interferase family)
MRIPRSVSGKRLARALEQVGYQITRQTGSHMRLTCNEPNQRHVTIPNHDSIRIGTLSAIISDVANNLGIPKEELIRKLF